MVGVHINLNAEDLALTTRFGQGLRLLEEDADDLLLRARGFFFFGFFGGFEELADRLVDNVGFGLNGAKREGDVFGGEFHVGETLQRRPAKSRSFWRKD